MRTGREMSNLNIAKSKSLRPKLRLSYIGGRVSGVLGAENEDENVESAE